MKSIVNSKKLKIVACLLAMAFFLGCKKQNACNDVIQGDWELVE